MQNFNEKFGEKRLLFLDSNVEQNFTRGKSPEKSGTTPENIEDKGLIEAIKADQKMKLGMLRGISTKIDDLLLNDIDNTQLKDINTKVKEATLVLGFVVDQMEEDGSMDFKINENFNNKIDTVILAANAYISSQENNSASPSESDEPDKKVEEKENLTEREQRMVNLINISKAEKLSREDTKKRVIGMAPNRKEKKIIKEKVDALLDRYFDNTGVAKAKVNQTKPTKERPEEAREFVARGMMKLKNVDLVDEYIAQVYAEPVKTPEPQVSAPAAAPVDAADPIVDIAPAVEVAAPVGAKVVEAPAPVVSTPISEAPATDVAPPPVESTTAAEFAVSSSVEADTPAQATATISAPAPTQKVTIEKNIKAKSKTDKNSKKHKKGKSELKNLINFSDIGSVPQNAFEGVEVEKATEDKAKTEKVETSPKKHGRKKIEIKAKSPAYILEQESAKSNPVIREKIEMRKLLFGDIEHGVQEDFENPPKGSLIADIREIAFDKSEEYDEQAKSNMIKLLEDIEGQYKDYQTRTGANEVAKTKLTEKLKAKNEEFQKIKDKINDLKS